MSDSEQRQEVAPPLAAIACIGIATLTFEVLLTRIFSVTMWYHFAFVAISLALFGIAASGVFVSVAHRLFARERALKAMGVASLLFGLAIPASFVFDLNLPFIPFDSALVEQLHAPMLPYVLFLAKFIVLSLPFFLSGLCIALAFTHAPTQVNRIYFADLAGGGAGCVISVALLWALSGPSAVILTAVFAFVAAALFFARVGARVGVGVAVVGALAVAGFVSANETDRYVAIDLVKSYDPKYGQVEEKEKIFEKWHPVSRVAVFPTHNSQSSRGWFYSGKSPIKLPKLMEVTNDAGARTFIWPRRDLDELKRIYSGDVSDLGYSIMDAPDVLVVGVGGGKDILSALAFGCASVTGVELNPLMIEIVQERFANFSGRPYDDPRVTIAIDEARNYVASRDRRYDMIKISVTDTWAASVGGAYALSESYLYTEEAIGDFLGALEPGGFLSITRWYPQETFRLAALVTRVLHERGVEDPAAHILMARNGANMNFMVSNQPVDAAAAEAFAAATRAAKLVLVHAPGQPGSQSEDDVLHRKIISAPDPTAVGREIGLNIVPPTDDRPFFFNLVSFEQAAEGEYGSKGSFIFQHGRALSLLTGLLKLTLLLALIFVLGPVLLTVGRGDRGAVPRSSRFASNVYFLMLGLGYLLVEIPLLQQFILFLGHPTYAVTVVLFSMLVGSGAGSLLSGRLNISSWRRPGVLFLVIVGLTVLYGLVMPSLLGAIVGLPIALRIIVTVVLIAPVALLLGIPFPLGIGRAHRLSQSLVPWAWGVNGAASVAAPVLATLVAILSGFSTALYLGGACYAIAAGALMIFGRERVGFAAAAEGETSTGDAGVSAGADKTSAEDSEGSADEAAVSAGADEASAAKT